MRFFHTKAHRILKRNEFVELANTGRKIENEHFIAYFSPAQHDQSRLGTTVTKKVGKAVQRNRIKRIVREFFRLNRHYLSANWDINIIAKRHIAGITAEQANKSLQNIFKRISGYDDH